MSKLGKVLGYTKTYGMGYTIKKVYYRYRIKYKLGKKYFPFAITPQEREKQEAKQWDHKIAFSIVVPLYNTPVEYLSQLLDSVKEQTYDNWQLCLADASDGEDSQKITELAMSYAGEDSRICYKKLESNGGISQNTNEAIKMATGEYIALLDHDDLLQPSALYYVAGKAQEGADFIYTDELSFVGTTDCVQSIHLKPDFSWESFHSNNFICHFTAFHKKLLEEAGMFQKEFDGSQDYDLFLRLTEKAKKICHIPKVLYYWRLHEGSVASGVGAKPYTIAAGQKALEEHFRRMGLTAQVEPSEFGTFYQVKYDRKPGQNVLIVGENSRVKQWLLENLQNTQENVVLCDQKEFMDGMKQRLEKQDYVVFVRDGFIPLKEGDGWLTELLRALQLESNGIAGSVVYTPNDKIEHAGYGFSKEWPEKIQPLYYHIPKEDPAYMNRLRFCQSVSLLGGSVLAVKAEQFQETYGKMPVKENCGLQDVFADVVWFWLCLCGKRQKKTNVIVPYEPFCRVWQKSQKEYTQKNYRTKTEWRAFQEEFREELKEDACLNPNMAWIAKEYFMI